MMNHVLLLASGIQFAIILLLVLIVGGGITFLVVKEKQRKDRARLRAEERRRIREEAILKAKQGQLNAFAAMTTVSATGAPAQTPESVKEMSQTQWNLRVENRKDNLNAMLNQAQMQEVPVQPMQPAAPQPMQPAQMAQPMQPAQPSVNPAVMGGIAAGAAAGAVGMAAAMNDAPMQSAPAAAAPQPVPQPTVAPAPERSIVNFRALAEQLDSVEEAPAQPEQPTANPVQPAISNIVEDDIDMTPKFHTEAQMEEVSAFKPYKDEYEDIAAAFEQRDLNVAPAPMQDATMFVPVQETAPVQEPARAAAAYVAPSVSAPIDNFFASAPMASAPMASVPMASAPMADLPVEPQEDLGKTKAFNFAVPELDEVPQETIRVDLPGKYTQPQYNQQQFTQPQMAQPAFDPVAFQNGSTASFEALAATLPPEQREAARAARMAEKAKYAAALAGEIDIEDVQNQNMSQAMQPMQPGPDMNAGYYPVNEEGPVSLLPEGAEEEEIEEEDDGKLSRIFLWILAVILMLICIGSAIYIFLGGSTQRGSADSGNSVVVTEVAQTSVVPVESSVVVEESSVPEDSSAEEIVETEPEPEPEPVFTTFVEEPHFVKSTDPANWEVTQVFSTKGETVESYTRGENLSFGVDSEYTQLEGVTTFRGNNYRNDPAYGTAKIEDEEFNGSEWVHTIGGLSDSDGDVWSGCGWTGQPLIVKWPKSTRQIMNMYTSAKEKEELVEVIYATMDGNVYFYDLETGDATRDSLFLGMTFKGAGSIDPRGIPLMYVGSGVYNGYGESPHAFIVSLIDGEVLYEFGPYDEIAHREWPAFDSSPILNAATDTLIWPGENGVFYTVKLNTKYDESKGELSIDPEMTKMSYNSSHNGYYENWLGMECSVVCFDHYAYFSENSGMFFCVDMNTMQIVWAQDTKDDSNSTPVFQFDEKTGRGYIFTAPSLHWTREGDTGNVPIYKLDAITGEILWQNDYHCYTITELSGGVQSTPAIGRVGTNLEGIIFYTIARWEGFYDGLLVALDTETGKEVWRWEMSQYTWSSPVAVYNEKGEGYIVVFDADGDGFLMDGLTGERKDTCSVGWLVEASPAVYEDKIVVGTRGSQIYCIDLE